MDVCLQSQVCRPVTVASSYPSALQIKRHKIPVISRKFYLDFGAHCRYSLWRCDAVRDQENNAMTSPPYLFDSYTQIWNTYGCINNLRYMMTRGISPPPLKRQKMSGDEAKHIKTSSAPTLEPPEGHAMRIFSWNINGIAPFLQTSITSFLKKRASEANRNIEPASLRDFLRRHSWPAILFLQEVKIPSSDTTTQDAVRAAIRAKPILKASGSLHEPSYEAHFTLPCDPHNARGLRGNGRIYGVCSIIREDIASRFSAKVRTVDWDKEGRVSVVELRNKTSKLAVFNIYAVNGTDNPYRDPATGAVWGTRHDRKLAFHRLLMEECLSLEQNGWEVLLAGDMNVAPATIDGHPRLRTFPQQHVTNRADFNEKLLGGKKQADEQVFHGVDIFREMYKTEKRYTYFPRGREWGSSCDRVDYVVVGRRLWDKGMVCQTGILDSEAERGPSDHVPVWVDFNFGETSKEEK